MFWIFVWNVVVIMLQMKSFGPPKNEFHAGVQKCHFARIEKLTKWHFWTCTWNFLLKYLIWNIMRTIFWKISLACPRIRQIHVYQSRKLRFFKKDSVTRFQKFFSLSVPVNTKQDWIAKLESAYTLMVHYCKNTVCCKENRSRLIPKAGWAEYRNRPKRLES